ncbi:MAG: hypothetical protein NW218_18520 [Saprospiraceae bacterium]|nr:hypothetical protein [Saprospiraceae bacterium]
MAVKISPLLIKAVNDHGAELETLISERPDWTKAAAAFDTFFQSLSNPNDPLWSASNFSVFKKAYFEAKETDKGMSNITLRTLACLSDGFKNDAKKMFLQTAHVCGIFNALHKVNFEKEELPDQFDAVPMLPGKAKGQFTYAQPLPAIYKKTSLTFDYWMPKILEWAEEIRSKNLQSWRGESILAHESCTDFMRCCLLFLSNPETHTPIAKAEDREAILTNWFGLDFVWVKKSAKREDILGNNQRLVEGFHALSKAAETNIPLEAWSRLQSHIAIKSLIK